MSVHSRERIVLSNLEKIVHSNQGKIVLNSRENPVLLYLHRDKHRRQLLHQLQKINQNNNWYS